MLKSIRLRFPSAATIERWPGPLRGLLGLAAACLAVTITYSVHPLRAFPLLLAFPTVILVSWFLGMWGGAACAVAEAFLVDLVLTRTRMRFAIGDAREELRLTLFLFLSIFVGWAVRRLARQREELATHQLNQRLMLVEADRRIAEERALAGTALRDRDELLQMALQANGMGLWVWDIKQDKVHRSDEMFRMLGREPGSFGEDPEEWLKHIHPDDREGLVTEFQRVRSTGADYHRQYRVIRPDGSVRWVESQGKCQRDTDGSIARIVGVLADITHRRQTEEAMLRAEKLAVAGKLAASVAHEINNPLAAVANLLYLITMADQVESAKERARTALDELMRVSMITQQTLKFHRQTGTPRETQLSELVESVLALLRARLRAAHIGVEMRIREELPVSCMAGEIQQIFANLLTNAVEATSRGGKLVIRFRPSVDWRNPGVRGMRVTFCDSGYGMDRATLRRVFEPFFTTKIETGTGLGMWVVGQLVERHNGHVRGWSRQREGASGTAFSVFLPYAPVRTDAEAEQPGAIAAKRDLPEPALIAEPGAR
jgi:PAS domain S-box-containing protein